MARYGVPSKGLVKEVLQEFKRALGLIRVPEKGSLKGSMWLL